MDKLFSNEGVNYILADYEHISRGPAEAMRPFINRYRRRVVRTFVHLTWGST